MTFGGDSCTNGTIMNVPDSIRDIPIHSMSERDLIIHTFTRQEVLIDQVGQINGRVRFVERMVWLATGGVGILGFTIGIAIACWAAMAH